MGSWTQRTVGDEREDECEPYARELEGVDDFGLKLTIKLLKIQNLVALTCRRMILARG